MSPIRPIGSMNDNQFVELFSYGTLQDEAVQLSTFGRRLEGVPDQLPGFRQSKIPITDQPDVTDDEFYFNAEPTGQDSDIVTGTRFKVTEQELEEADVYEAPAHYKRITVRLKSGITAWVYVHHEAA